MFTLDFTSKRVRFNGEVLTKKDLVSYIRKFTKMDIEYDLRIWDYDNLKESLYNMVVSHSYRDLFKNKYNIITL